MKKGILSLIMLITGSVAFSQVEKTILAEHFTNTRCGVCASKNPGFYQNLAGHPHVLHLAIHPSSPYSDCALHLENPTENDGRTNYYSVYGGTPRLVIQGEAQPFSIDFSSPETFDPYEGQTSPFSINIKEYRIGTDSIRAELTIKAVSGHGHESADIFLACAEDTVFYQAPNGENEHYDVFRKAFTSVEGNMLSLPPEGDSILMSYAIAVDSGWDPDRLYVIGVIQDSQTKEIIQAGKTSSVEYLSSILSAYEIQKNTLHPYPNPASSVITLGDVSGYVNIYSLDGRIVYRHDAGVRKNDLQIDITSLENGLYVIRNENSSGSFIKR
jgi:hypothetical protein